MQRSHVRVPGTKTALLLALIPCSIGLATTRTLDCAAVPSDDVAASAGDIAVSCRLDGSRVIPGSLRLFRVSSSGQVADTGVLVNHDGPDNRPAEAGVAISRWRVAQMPGPQDRLVVSAAIRGELQRVFAPVGGGMLPRRGSPFHVAGLPLGGGATINFCTFK